MKKWGVLLFYTISLATVTYVSFRLLLFSVLEATQFPNGLFLFGLLFCWLSIFMIGTRVRKHIFSVSRNEQERVKLQVSFIVCTIAAVWGMIWFLV